MQREEVMNVVQTAIVAALDGNLEMAFDPARSMVELGASSLDIVEIISNVTRELRVRVARAELAELKNVDALVDLLTKVKNESR